MSVLLGTSHPLALPVDAVPAERAAAFAEYLRQQLAIRKDTAYTLAAFAAAVATCPAARFSLATLQRYAPPALGVGPDSFRNALTERGCTEEDLLEALVAATPFDSIRAVLIQLDVLAIAGVDWSVLSLHALGEGWIVPLDWRRYRAEPRELDPASAEHACVAELLQSLGKAYETVKPEPTTMPPLVAMDERVGETRRLRKTIAGTVREYALAVREDYAGHGIEFDVPYVDRQHDRGISDAFGAPSPTDPLPRPQLIAPEIVAPGEFAAPFLLAGEVRYAVTRVVAPWRLGGYRKERRAQELTQLLACIEAPPMTRVLRMNGFQFSNDDGWRRGALVVSLFHAFLSACSRSMGAHPTEGDTSI